MACLTKDEFDKLKPVIEAELAAAIENKLRKMGDDIHGISWFSSKAEQHPKNAT
jgi:hypothetical protein